MILSSDLPLRARFLPLPDPVPVEAPPAIMFAPAGTHTVTPALGETAIAEVTLRVDPSTAAVLNASLQSLNARNAPQRACFDKNHEGKEAMAWPSAFEWRDAPKPGVYALVEWTKLGLDYVAGKVMRAFSGAFYSDADLPKRKDIRAGQAYAPAAGKRGSPENPARIIGLDFPFAGTLTNDPAFRDILPLFSNAHRPPATDHRPPTTDYPLLLHEAANDFRRRAGLNRAGA